MSERICSVDGCERQSRTRGMCNAHYQRWRRTGDPLGTTGRPPAKPPRCTIPDCDDERRTALHCPKHDSRLRKNGDPLATKALLRSLATAKSCTRCGEWKAMDDYYGDPRASDGKQGRCKNCYNELERERYTPERRAASIARIKEWRKTPEGKAARQRESLTGSAKAVERARRWAAENPERAKAASRAAVIRRRERLGIVKGRVRGTRSSDIAARWDYYGRCCWICGTPATQTDHVKPVAAGGSDLPCNLRPICWPCNSRKGAKWPFTPAMIGAAA